MNEIITKKVHHFYMSNRHVRSDEYERDAARKQINLYWFYPVFMRIARICEYEQHIAIYLESSKRSQVCPVCGCEASWLHATLTRTAQYLYLFWISRLFCKSQDTTTDVPMNPVNWTTFADNDKGFLGRYECMTNISAF